MEWSGVEWSGVEESIRTQVNQSQDSVDYRDQQGQWHKDKTRTRLTNIQNNITGTSFSFGPGLTYRTSSCRGAGESSKGKQGNDHLGGGAGGGRGEAGPRERVHRWGLHVEDDKSEGDPAVAGQGGRAPVAAIGRHSQRRRAGADATY